MRRRTSHRQSQKESKKTETGIDGAMSRFFLGGEGKIAGFMHINAPRLAPEYEQMGIGHLVRRIQDDLEELLARAYPTYFEERMETFAPNRSRKFRITYAGRLRLVIQKSVAEELRQGLWERIISAN